MMRYWGVVFCFCLWGWGVQGQPEVALKQLLETPGLNHAAIGISVKKVGDGTTVLAHQAGMALTPASVTKLLPTVFALQERGKDFRFKTLGRVYRKDTRWYFNRRFDSCGSG